MPHPPAPPPHGPADPWQPSPVQWQPGPPEPGPGAATRIGIVAGAIVVAVAFTVVGVLLTDNGDPGTATPPSAEATSLASPSASGDRTPSATTSPLPPMTTAPPPVTVAPEPGGRPWVLPDRQWAPIPAPDPASKLYPMQVSMLDELPPVPLTGCPEPRAVTDEEDWKAAVRGQWSCLHRAWVPVFEQLGWSVVEPEVRFYPGVGSNSDCGYLSAPAFYCSYGSGAVYFGAEHFTMASDWDLSVNEMVNHEYGHHLQKLAGITSAKLSLPPSNELERRAELQSTCWSAMFTYHNRSFGFDATHFESWTTRLDTMLVDDVHGSRESLTYWGTRGLYAETVGDCNTWRAPAEQVE